MPTVFCLLFKLTKDTFGRSWKNFFKMAKNYRWRQWPSVFVSDHASFCFGYGTLGMGGRRKRTCTNALMLCTHLGFTCSYAAQRSSPTANQS